jgi:anti-sigma regulatory factor (Ser/Thr protein kinase)
MDRLTVPGTIDSLDAISAFSARAAIEAGLDEKAAYRLHLAVDEIATNIIAHGYASESIDGVLELWIEIDEERLIVCIEDTGLSYDPTKYQRPDDLDLPPDQRPVGGLGVYLTLRSVDRFSYERIQNRNRHTLIINR